IDPQEIRGRAVARPRPFPYDLDAQYGAGRERSDRQAHSDPADQTPVRPNKNRHDRSDEWREHDNYERQHQSRAWERVLVGRVSLVGRTYLTYPTYLTY